MEDYSDNNSTSSGLGGFVLVVLAMIVAAWLMAVVRYALPLDPALVKLAQSGILVAVIFAAMGIGRLIFGSGKSL